MYQIFALLVENVRLDGWIFDIRDHDKLCGRKISRVVGLNINTKQNNPDNFKPIKRAIAFSSKLKRY